MKTEKQVETRLKAENAACRTDKTLLKNDYVCGYTQALEWVLGLVEN